MLGVLGILFCFTCFVALHFHTMKGRLLFFNKQINRKPKKKKQTKKREKKEKETISQGHKSISTGVTIRQRR